MAVLSGPVAAASVATCAFFSGAYFLQDLFPEGQSGHAAPFQKPSSPTWSSVDDDEDNDWMVGPVSIFAGVFVIWLIVLVCFLLKSLLRKKSTHTEGYLKLRVFTGRNLGKIQGEVSDAYCRAMVGTKENSTKTIKNNLNPVWQEETHGNVLVVSNGNFRRVDEVHKEGVEYSKFWDSNGRMVADHNGGAFVISHGNLRHVNETKKEGEVWSKGWNTDDSDLCADGRGGLFVVSHGNLYHVTELQKDGGVAWSEGWKAEAMTYSGSSVYVISRTSLYKVNEAKKGGLRLSRGWARDSTMCSNGDGGLFVISSGHLYLVDEKNKLGKKWSSNWLPSGMVYAGQMGLFILSRGHLFKVTAENKNGEKWSTGWSEKQIVTNGSDSLYIISHGNLRKVTVDNKDGELFSIGWNAASMAFSEAKSSAGEWSFDVDLNNSKKSTLQLDVFDASTGLYKEPVFTSIGQAKIDITEFAAHEGTSISKTVQLLDSHNGQPNGREVTIKARFEEGAETAQSAAAPQAAEPYSNKVPVSTLPTRTNRYSSEEPVLPTNSVPAAPQAGMYSSQESVLRTNAAPAPTNAVPEVKGLASLLRSKLPTGSKASTGSALPKLPAGWECAKDEKTGEMYYYNHNTQETQWELPQA